MVLKEGAASTLVDGGSVLDDIIELVLDPLHPLQYILQAYHLRELHECIRSHHLLDYPLHCLLILEDLLEGGFDEGGDLKDGLYFQDKGLELGLEFPVSVGEGFKGDEVFAERGDLVGVDFVGDLEGF